MVRAFADTLRQIHADLDPDDVQIDVIGNADASLTALKEAFRYAAFAIGPDDLFVLYYAGHRYHTATGNRLTAYDTNPQNLSDTTIDLTEDVLGPLADSKCKRALLIVDACTEHVQEFDHARDGPGVRRALSEPPDPRPSSPHLSSTLRLR